MRGKAEISYTDSRGNVFDLMSDGLRRIHTASFHEYSWDKDVTSKRFGEKLRAFKKGALSLSTTIYFDGPNKEKHLNEFHSATEYDIVNDQPGTLKWEDYSISCYMVSSKTHPAEEKIGAPAANEVVFYCPDPFWTKLQSYSSYTANDRPVKAARIAANKNPIKELTGELVHFDDAKEGSYLPKTILTVEPKQDLHGYDHPWVGGAGKNLFDPAIFADYKQADGSYKGTTTQLNSRGIDVPSNLAGKTLTASIYFDLSHNPDTNYWRLVATTPPSSVYADCAKGDKKRVSITFTASENSRVYITYGSGAGYVIIKEPQLELGSTATAYEPYENICPLEPYDKIELYHTDEYSDHNIWDEEWSPYSSTQIQGKNKIKVTPGTTYYIKAPTTIGLYFYDVSGNSVGALYKRNETFSPPTNSSYMYMITTNYGGNIYNHDICINVSDPSFNGQYEPYHNSRPKLDTEPYLVRAERKLGRKAYDKLVGMTVAWNQLVPKPTGWNFGGTGMTADGLTISVDSSGFINITGTSTSPVAPTILPNPTAPYVSANHVILITCEGWKENANWSWGRAGFAYVGKNFNINKHTAQFSASPRIQVELGKPVNIRARFMAFDLTQMFGSEIADYFLTLGAEGGGNLFRKYFREPWYWQNYGELISTAPTAKEVTGKNLVSSVFEDYRKTVNYHVCDLKLEKGQYYIASIKKIGEQTNGWTLAIIKDGDAYNNFVSATYIYNSNRILLPTYKFLVDDTYTNPKVAIWLSNGGNTEENYRENLNAFLANYEFQIEQTTRGGGSTSYEPYHVTRYQYPNIELNGIPKIVNGQLTSDGDTLESDGTYLKKYGLVDLGTLMWTYVSGRNMFYAQPVTGMANAVDGVAFNMLTAKYSTSSIAGFLTYSYDKSIALGTTGMYKDNICIRDTTLGTDVSSFKQAMSGVMLLYELAEPITGKTTPFISPQKVDPLGLEIYEDKRPVPIPVCHETKYYDGVMHQFKSSQFGGDVYGLTIDLVSGEIKKTHQKVSSSQCTYGLYDASTARITVNLPSGYPPRYPTPVAEVPDMYCTNLKVTSKNSLTALDYVISQYDGNVETAFIMRINSDVNTAAKGREWVDAHPFELVYEIKTPEVIYQLTPRQLKALTGDNYVFGSDGVVTLAYISDFDPHMLLNADGTPLTPQEGLVYVIQEGEYKGHEFVWNGEEYLDLTSAIIKAYEPAHPYAYDYKADFESYLSLTNDNELGSKYVAIIYGPCKNPDIILANDGEEDDVEIAINTDVPAGGRLVVDSTDKTVTKYMPDGSTLNCFGQIDKEAGYLWTKVPYGLSHVIWDGSFDFDLLLIEERSEPKWLLG